MKTALLVDGNNVMWRAYHAVQQDLSARGIRTNAVRGFFNVLEADVREFEPTYVVVAFDKGASWRTQIFEEYKGTRSRDTTDRDHIVPQFKVVKSLLEAAGVCMMYKAGREADDIIRTTAGRFEERGVQVLINSTDKDFAQCVSDLVQIIVPRSRDLIGPEEVFDKFGAYPDKMIEVQMMVGDAVDNIPGIHKVSYKTASKLLNEWGSLRELFKNAKKLTPAMSKRILEAKRTIDWKLQRKLVTLCTDEECHFDRKRMRLNEPNVKELERICSHYRLSETYRLIQKIHKMPTSKRL